MYNEYQKYSLFLNKQLFSKKIIEKKQEENEIKKPLESGLKCLRILKAIQRSVECYCLKACFAQNHIFQLFEVEVLN